MLKREWDAESNGKLPHLFIPGKTAALIPELAVEDLHLSRTVALVPEFSVKNLPLGRIIDKAADDNDAHHVKNEMERLKFCDHC